MFIRVKSENNYFSKLMVQEKSLPILSTEQIKLELVKKGFRD